MSDPEDYDEEIYEEFVNPRYQGDDMLYPTYDIFGRWQD